MKNLIFIFVALFALSFMSCGNKPISPIPVNDSDSDSVVVDSDSVVTTDSIFH